MDVSALIAASCLWLIMVSSARAEQPALDWHAPSGCPDADSVEEAIADAADPGAQGVVRVVRADVLATDEGYSMVLSLETAEATHRKRLFAKLCSTFVELLLLELSFASVPAAAGEERDVPPAAKPSWGLRASGVIGTGPAPKPSPGVALALALSVRRLRLELAGSYALPKVIRYADLKQIGARFEQVGAELRGCFMLPVRRVELPLCAGAELGGLHGHGVGLETTASPWRLWAGFFLAPGLHFPIAGPVSGWLEVAGSWLVRRPRFGVRNLPDLYRPDLLGVRGALAVVVTFD